MNGHRPTQVSRASPTTGKRDEVLREAETEPQATIEPRRRPMKKRFVVVAWGVLVSMVATLDSLGHEVLAMNNGESVIQSVADDLQNVHLVATVPRTRMHAGPERRRLRRRSPHDWREPLRPASSRRPP